MIDTRMPGDGWWKRTGLWIRDGLVYAVRVYSWGFLFALGLVTFLMLWQISVYYHPYIAVWLGVTRCQ